MVKSTDRLYVCNVCVYSSLCLGKKYNVLNYESVSVHELNKNCFVHPWVRGLV